MLPAERGEAEKRFGLHQCAIIVPQSDRKKKENILPADVPDIDTDLGKSYTLRGRIRGYSLCCLRCRAVDRSGGIVLKRYKMSKKLSVFCLAAAAAVMTQAAFLPGTVYAEETEETETMPGSEADSVEIFPGADMEISKEENEAVDNIAEAAENKIAETSENSIAETSGNDTDDMTGNSTEGEPSDDAEIPEEGAAEDQGQTAVYPILIPIGSGSPQYEQLSAFLALSADRFQMYMVTFADGQGKPVQPDGPVQAAADIPEGYDMERTVVSEISMEGDTPLRTELSYTVSGGKALFQTDHAGLFVIMEKKALPELPPSLDMTDKVEPFDLTKYSGSAGSGTGQAVFTSVPATGDQAAPFLWIGGSAAVSTGLLLFVIANSTKNSKKY